MPGSVQAQSAHEGSEGVDAAIRCPTAGQQHAAKALREAIDQRQAVVVVFGDSGAGKTDLINSVLDAMDSQQYSVFSFSATSGEFSSPPTFDNILEAMCQRLGAPQPINQRPETLATLSSITKDLVHKGRTLILAIDHADHLTADFIAEVVQLGEYLNTPPNRLIRVFVGSMSLASRVDSVLRQARIDDRMSEIRVSQPTAAEVAALLAYEDGAQPGGPMLTSSAIERISAYAKSNLHWAVPMADAARVLAESEGKSEVTAETVRSALLEIWSPEQRLVADPAIPIAQSGLGMSSPASGENEVPMGMSDSVGRASTFDLPEATEPEAPAIEDDANVALHSRKRHLAVRFTPVFVVLLFIIGAIPLSSRDVVMHREFEQVSLKAEEARSPDPSLSPAINSQEARRQEQTEPASGSSPSEAPQIPDGATDSVKSHNLVRSDASTAPAGVESKAEQYGPWLEATTSSQGGEPPATDPEEEKIDTPQETLSDEPVRKTKSAPQRRKLVLEPPERRPEDLTSKHWIQER